IATENNKMAWLLVFAAGILEIVWAVALKCSDGFTKPMPVIIMLAAMVCSGALLGLSLKWVPISTGYAVWTGIGAAGTAAVGIMAFNESASALKIFFLSLIVIGVIGLPLATSGT